MLLGTVLLWALNITVTRYMFLHGWRPLSYGTIRYFAAIALFSGLLVYLLLTAVARSVQFYQVLAQNTRDITYLRGGQPMGFTIKNTNQLLGKYGVDGGKTGSTRRAGDCLIATSRKPDRFVPVNNNQKQRIPYRLVTVVLGSPDRFGQTAGLVHFEQPGGCRQQMHMNEVKEKRRAVRWWSCRV